MGFLARRKIRKAYEHATTQALEQMADLFCHCPEHTAKRKLEENREEDRADTMQFAFGGGVKREPSIASKIENGDAVIMGVDPARPGHIVIAERHRAESGIKPAESEFIKMGTPTFNGIMVDNMPRIESPMSKAQRKRPVPLDEFPSNPPQSSAEFAHSCANHFVVDCERYAATLKDRATSEVDAARVVVALAELASEVIASCPSLDAAEQDTKRKALEDLYLTPSAPEKPKFSRAIDYTQARCACEAPATWLYDPNGHAEVPGGLQVFDLNSTPLAPSYVAYCGKHGPNTPPLEDKVDDGAVPEPSEVDAVMRSGICDNTELMGREIVWYETDGRGGKRYTLPAIITAVQRTHVDYPTLMSAIETEDVELDDYVAFLSEHAKTAGWKTDAFGIWVPQGGHPVGNGKVNPVPIPHQGTVHLHVLTPGPLQQYQEFSVAYDPTGKQARSWRHNPSHVPF